ncbi:MAG: DUF58 domain-containing protein [Spirochaetaceae bacterium]|jgi:uncharacterized protein (DUF58 family)|nr:DUF58 domain-containing protein [Spirochaetaceae bacterium]
MKSAPVLFFAALLWFFLGIGAFFSPLLALIWFLSGLALLVLVLLDALFLMVLTDRLGSEREVNSTLVLGRTFPVRVIIRPARRGFVPSSIQIFDLYPPAMSPSSQDLMPVRLDAKVLKNNGAIVFEYTLTPSERGAWEFERLHLLLGSPLRFWHYKAVHDTASKGRTYPDFKKILGGQDLRGLLERTGLKSIRMRGQGLDFQGLREYQIGDPVRDIDWRATSRRLKPIVREYQEERDQQVLLLIDSGYRLHRQEGDYTQFDSAINAALLLSYVALKHEDSVALGVFGNGDHWLPPHKGISALSALINELYDLKSAPLPSSPFSALEQAITRLNRRSFIILISNFREEDGESLSWILPRVKHRHLLLTVSLREKEAEELARQKPGTTEDSYVKAAAYSYLYSRRQLYKTWEHLGVHTLESSAADLSPALINRYLRIKRSGEL